MDIDEQTFLSSSRLPPDSRLGGADLERVFWRYRALDVELTRQKAFWRSTNEALSEAFVQLRLLTGQLQAELAVARTIQQSLLPPRLPALDGLQVVCYCNPAEAVGGDFYDYGALGGRRFALAVGDVSGKGLPAAFLMAISLAYLDSAVQDHLAPRDLLARLDRELERYTGATRQNCALCYVEVEGRHLRVVNAGGIPPYIRRASGQVERVNVGGLPLGTGYQLFDTYHIANLTLEPGDLCILTSDGVVEANVSRRDLFGFPRLEQAIAAAPVASPQAMLDHLVAEISSFVGDAAPHDDVTIVVCQMTAETAS